MKKEQRILGGLNGSLVGDALGVPVEFKSRTERGCDPVIGMRDYGTHGQPKGTWSDDGALLLCSAESLVEKGFDTQDMGDRFVRWYTKGYWTAHGTIFDIGIATRRALNLIEQGCPAELAGGEGEYDNGNGSLMRILPVTLAFHREDYSVLCDRLGRASAITHAHERSKMACVFHGLLVTELLKGLSPHFALDQTRRDFSKRYEQSPEFPAFSDLMNADLVSWSEANIQSGGYVMETLTASLWCLLTTSNFDDCVLKAVNLGDDADTTGCVTGGLAGVFYGQDAIPLDWIKVLPRRSDLANLFQRFIQRCQQS